MQRSPVQNSHISAQDHAPASISAWRELQQFAPLWAVVAFVGFYASLPYIPYQRELLIRYCSSHPIEYATMALFFLGMSTLVVLRLNLIGEQASLARLTKLVKEVSELKLLSAQENVEKIGELLQGPASKLQETAAGRRLHSALRYFSESDSVDQLDGHLRHLADLEADQAAQRFGLVNTVTWAVPIIGFLGTVMGITLAIANVTPDQLHESLHEVTGGLAIAFDTTALSLCLSMGLVFSSFLVKRQQDDILLRIDQQLDHPLCFLLKKSSAPLSLMGQQHIVSEQLIGASATIVAEATELWRNKLQHLEEAFAESLSREQLRVAEVLQKGVTSSLGAHQGLLDEMRQQESAQYRRVADQIETAMKRWESSLSNTSSHLTEQSQELRSHTALIISLIDKQRELELLQQQIHQAIDSNQIVSTLDQTLNSLTAAIQLLSIRTNVSSRAA